MFDSGFNLPPGCFTSHLPGWSQDDEDWDYWIDSDEAEEVFWEWMEDHGYRKDTPKRRQEYAVRQEAIDFEDWQRKQAIMAEDARIDARMNDMD